MIVMFDLPVVEDIERKRAAKFRKYLEEEGFSMSQFSVYSRFCGPRERAEAFAHRIQEHLPPYGKVSILFFTDKQYGQIIHYHNLAKTRQKEKPEQYLFFGDE